MRLSAIAGSARRILGIWLVGLLGAALLAGSAGAQDAATIAQARAALEAARSSRAVRALAAPELDAAEEALERALAARDAEPPGEVGHLAYLAVRRAAIARMHAKERKIERALESLSATHALLAEARALEAAAAAARAKALAQGLARFDVRADRHGLLLTPRERWFEADLALARGAVRAIAEAARLLGELPEREVVVLGYAMRGAPPQAAVQGSRAGTAQLPAGYRAAGAQAGAQRQASGAGVGAPAAIDRDDLGCARAEVVRAFLISHGVDPRRIAAACVAPGVPGAAQAGPSAGATAIRILPEHGAARIPTIAATRPRSAAR